MRLESIQLTDFRNLRHVELEPHRRFNVIVGPNGQGKTNFVEAVALLSTLKSFRSAKNAQLIRHGADQAVARAFVDRADVRREVEVRIRPTSKRVSLNGNYVRRLADFFGAINTVSFTPDDVGVLKGSPSERRLLLDRMIFHAHPAFADESASYEQALKQRNALLRQEYIDRALLEVYDEQLADLGVRVVKRRCAMIDELRAPFRSAFADIFSADLPVDLAYSSAWFDPASEADDAGLHYALRQAFRGARRADEARGFTTVGPHRDDLATSLDGQPVRGFASQGQQRAFVLALKITEIRTLERRIGAPPILVLDDVSSELDPVRNRQLFDFLAGFDGQVFITTTDASYIHLDHERTTWHVHDGELTDERPNP